MVPLRTGPSLLFHLRRFSAQLVANCCQLLTLFAQVPVVASLIYTATACWRAPYLKTALPLNGPAGPLKRANETLSQTPPSVRCALT
jgi:hypothetical protein